MGSESLELCILAKMEANRAGAGEGLMPSCGGCVAEATGDSLLALCGEKMLTPPPHVGILEGITRTAAMELVQRIKIPVSERMLTLHDIYNADECFLTGTAAEFIPAVKVDGRLIGTGRRPAHRALDGGVSGTRSGGRCTYQPLIMPLDWRGAEDVAAIYR